METVKLKQEITKISNTVTEMKTANGFNSRPDTAKKTISELEDMSIEICQT